MRRPRIDRYNDSYRFKSGTFLRTRDRFSTSNRAQKHQHTEYQRTTVPRFESLALKNSMIGLSQFTLSAVFKGNYTLSSEALTKFRLAYFSLLLCGRAWDLLTNSPGQGRDFMSEIGLVQAAMKEVDKISKTNA